MAWGVIALALQESDLPCTGFCRVFQALGTLGTGFTVTQRPLETYRRIAIQGAILAGTVKAFSRRAKAMAKVSGQLEVGGFIGFGFAGLGAFVPQGVRLLLMHALIRVASIALPVILVGDVGINSGFRQGFEVGFTMVAVVGGYHRFGGAQP